MDDIVKSIKAQLYDRVSSPLMGAFLISWIIWNYKLFVVIFTGEDATDILLHISELYPTVELSIYGIALPSCLGIMLGKIPQGFIYPSITTLLYFYVYPWMARKIYQIDLKQKAKLRQCKQEIENQRLLSVEESNRILYEVESQKTLHEADIIKLQRRIADTEERYNHQLESNANLQDKINSFKSNQKSHPDSDINLETKKQEEIIKKATPDEILELQIDIRKKVHKFYGGKFNIRDLIRETSPRILSEDDQKELENWFAAQVFFHNFSNVDSFYDESENEGFYKKRPENLNSTDEILHFMASTNLDTHLSTIANNIGTSKNKASIKIASLIENGLIKESNTDKILDPTYRLTLKGNIHLDELCLLK